MTRTGNGNYGTNKINIIFPEIKKTNNLLGGDLNIYKLNGKDSPFVHIPMYYTFTGEQLEEKMLDFFQYIVYIRNSKATEPLRDQFFTDLEPSLMFYVFLIFLRRNFI